MAADALIAFVVSEAQEDEDADVNREVTEADPGCVAGKIDFVEDPALAPAA